MYYIVYRTTNLINSKIYIGCHKTTDLNDGYLGSGKLLRSAIKKYGIENFKKETLQIFDNPEEMFEMESVLVNEEFIGRKDTYNLKEGGKANWYYLNEFYWTNEKRIEHNRRYSPFKDKEWQENNKENLKKWSKSGGEEYKKKYGNESFGIGFTGKTHTQESRDKISKTKKEKGDQIGERNSQYGKKKSDKEKDRIKETLKNKPLMKCLYCDFSSNNIGIINRWHNTNCKKASCAEDDVQRSVPPP